MFSTPVLLWLQPFRDCESEDSLAEPGLLTSSDTSIRNSVLRCWILEYQFWKYIQYNIPCQWLYSWWLTCLRKYHFLCLLFSIGMVMTFCCYFYLCKKKFNNWWLFKNPFQECCSVLKLQQVETLPSDYSLTNIFQMAIVSEGQMLHTFRTRT